MGIGCVAWNDEIKSMDLHRNCVNFSKPTTDIHQRHDPRGDKIQNTRKVLLLLEKLGVCVDSIKIDQLYWVLVP
jgi:hypothetical protein